MRQAVAAPTVQLFTRMISGFLGGLLGGTLIGIVGGLIWGFEVAARQARWYYGKGE